MLKAKDFRHEAWGKMKGKWAMMALAYFIYSIILGVCAGLSWVGVGAVALLIIGGPLALGLYMIMLNVIRGGDARIDTLFEGFKDFARALVLYILIGIFTFLWTLLLIIPGIIKSLSYSMSYFVLIDHPELSSNEARKKSMQLMKGNKWRLFCLNFSFIGWILLCIITFGILSFWVQPYIMAARAAFYQSLIADEIHKEEQPVEEIPAQTETPAEDNGEV